MKVPMLFFTCLAFAATHAADSERPLEPSGPTEKTAYDMASRLVEIETVLPDKHRVLADGTWDNYEPAEKVAFLDLIENALRGTTSTEIKTGQASRIRLIENIRSAMRTDGDIEQLRLYDESTTEIELDRLHRIERSLRRARLVREGNVEAIREQDEQDEAELRNLFEEHPEYFPDGFDPDELSDLGLREGADVGILPVANSAFCSLMRSSCQIGAGIVLGEMQAAAEEQFKKAWQEARRVRNNCLYVIKFPPAVCEEVYQDMMAAARAVRRERYRAARAVFDAMMEACDVVYDTCCLVNPNCNPATD